MNTRADTAPAGHRALLAASGVLLVAVGVHAIDHTLQERGVGGVTIELIVNAQVNAALAVLAFALALRAHPRAPLIAAVGGAYIALGVTVGHFVPYWGSALSDPYADLNLGALSWAAAGFEVACAVVLAAVGFAVLRRRRATGHLALG